MKRGLQLAVLVVLACAIAACATGRRLQYERSSPPPIQVVANAGDSARVILQRYADAWRGQQELPLERNLVVAFWVKGDGGGDYHLVLSPNPGAIVRDGVPDRYDLGFELAIDFLRRLDRGDINALTAMGQARASDPIPLVPKFGPQFGDRSDAKLVFLRASFHFWTRGWPEIVRFGEGTTRPVHGGNATAFVYDREFRSAWYQVKPGMHINVDQRDQTNDYPNVVIVTRGRFKARLDGQERLLAEGEAVFIPAGMTHEFWAESDQYGEFVWIAFGEGA